MPTPDISMTGRVCLVTGASAGIGQETAEELARCGATVVVVGRSAERCAATVERIRQHTGNPAVEFLVADLSSQAEIRNLAFEFKQRHDRLHVLINNAGALFTTHKISADEIELTLALNHLGYFLLTHLLLDVIKASAPARIINVASGAHTWIKDFDFAGLSQPRSWGVRAWETLPLANAVCSLLAAWKHPGLWRYSQTKLANLLFTFELARRLEGTGVTVNALNPGLVASSFMEGNGILGFFMRRYARANGISVAEGAKTPIYLATSPEVEGVTGEYFDREKPGYASPQARDLAAAGRLWQISEQLTGIT